MAFYKRRDLQRIAESKLEDALLLLKHKRFSNAYYLAGYSIEIGLKACIAKQITAEVIPDKNFVNAIYQHELGRLVGVAGLTSELKKKEQGSAAFSANWALVTRWEPEARYAATDPLSAQLMIQAVIDQDAGVFAWIKTHW